MLMCIIGYVCMSLILNYYNNKVSRYTYKQFMHVIYISDQTQFFH